MLAYLLVEEMTGPVGAHDDGLDYRDSCHCG